MQLGKGEAAVGVYHCLQVVPAYAGIPNPLGLAHIEGVLAEQLGGCAAFHAAFPEAGIGPLNSSYLLGCLLDLAPGSLLFQFQQSLILGPHGVLVEDPLYGRSRYPNTHQRKLV